MRSLGDSGASCLFKLGPKMACILYTNAYYTQDFAVIVSFTAPKWISEHNVTFLILLFQWLNVITVVLARCFQLLRNYWSVVTKHFDCFTCRLCQWYISRWDWVTVVLTMVAVVSPAWLQSVSWTHFRVSHTWVGYVGWCTYISVAGIILKF